MRRDQPLDRIAEAGADTARIAQTTVLVKLAERPGCPIHAHPAWALCRALRAAGFGSLHVRGSMDYFDDLDSLLRWDDSQEPGAWFSDAVARMAPRSDIIIDVSNDVSSRARSLSLKKRWSADRVCVAWDSARVSVSATADSTVGFPRRAPDQRTATPMTCRLAAGLALSEALFTAGRWNNVAPLAHPVVYDAASPTRTGTDTVPSWPKAPVDGTVIDVIGAGGSGTNLLEALVPALGPGSTLRIFDADTVADENLATQPAFGREDLGLPKADAIAARLAALSPGGPDIVPFPIRYEEAAPNLSPPSLRITCPDSFAARAYVNSLCTQDGVPLADAGTAPLAAQVR
ncbi:MAG: ThiF family adenylyltransferase, partial [Phycisphaerae bacterium]